MGGGGTVIRDWMILQPYISYHRSVKVVVGGGGLRGGLFPCQLGFSDYASD